MWGDAEFEHDIDDFFTQILTCFTCKKRVRASRAQGINSTAGHIHIAGPKFPSPSPEERPAFVGWAEPGAPRPSEKLFVSWAKPSWAGAGCASSPASQRSASWVSSLADSCQGPAASRLPAKGADRAAVYGAQYATLKTLEEASRPSFDSDDSRRPLMPQQVPTIVPALEEILQSERTYVRMLHVLVDEYLPALRALVSEKRPCPRPPCHDAPPYPPRPLRGRCLTRSLPCVAANGIPAVGGGMRPNAF